MKTSKTAVLEYVLVAGSVAAGMAGVPWWIAVPATTAGLSAAALPKYLALLPRARAVGADGPVRSAMVQSALHATAAGSAAYVGGMAIRYALGLDMVWGR